MLFSAIYFFISPPKSAFPYKNIFLSQFFALSIFFIRSKIFIFSSITHTTGIFTALFQKNCHIYFIMRNLLIFYPKRDIIETNETNADNETESEPTPKSPLLKGVAREA